MASQSDVFILSSEECIKGVCRALKFDATSNRISPFRLLAIIINTQFPVYAPHYVSSMSGKANLCEITLPTYVPDMYRHVEIQYMHMYTCMYMVV